MSGKSSESVISSFLGGLADGACLSDAGGKVLYVNPAAQALLDRAAPLKGASTVCDLFCKRMVIHGEDSPGDCPLRAPSGTARGASFRGSLPLRTKKGAPPSASKAVMELRVRGLRLSGKSQDNCRVTLIENVEREAEIERQREDWRGMVAHDLRSPLTNVLGALRVLEELPVDQPLGEPDHGLIQAGVRASFKMVTLLDEYLDVSRVESGTMHVNHACVDMGRIAASAAADMRIQAQAAGVAIRVQVPEGLYCDADPEILARVLQNLLSNSLKFTSKAGGVTLTGEPLGGRAVMRVTDTGRGIDEDDLPHIFDRYYRGSRPGPKKGLGLGLTFCREALQAMGGTIAVDSKFGAGSTFTLSLPPGEMKAREVIKTGTEGFVMTDLEGQVLEVNDVYCRMSGFSREALLSMRLPELEGRDALTDLTPLKRRLATTGNERFETRHRNSDGIMFPLEASVQYKADAGGRLLVFLKDISTRKRFEAELRASEERERASKELMQTFIDNTPALVYMLDAQHRFTIVNKAFAALFGLTPSDFIGKRRGEMLAAEDAAEHEGNDLLIVKGGAAQLFEEHSTAGATPGTFLSTKFPIKGPDGDIVGVGGISTNISERKSTEAAMVSMQRLESLGTLAAGVAHDFNNILTGILGNISLLEQRVKGDEDSRALIQEAQRGCDTATSLARQMMTFSKGGTPVLKTLDLRGVLEQAAVFSARGTSARCVFDLGSVPLPAKIDPSQVSQVVGNLVINAAQAMPGAGEITIRAGEITLGKGKIPPLPPGRYIRVSVTDQGPGIPAEDRPRIFEPFFSTKSAGRGLGLAVCYSIMGKHGGLIAAGSAPGAGAVFTLYFPAAEATSIPAGPPPPAVTTGKGRVLVMDDEETVAKVLKRILESLGYRADCVKDGKAALDTYRQARQAGEPYGAVILDLTISGGMGGKETMAELAKLDPEARGIVSSGYSDDPVMSAPAAHGFRGTLAKPYRLEQVSEILSKVIGSKTA